ncbi:MAG: DMT family transporter [Kiloniellales bacterium]|nr:DMT family transporter [Kiloniellales bacterium]
MSGRLVGAVALVTVTLWAGTVIATKLAVAEMEPLAVALSRAWLAGLLALPLAVLTLRERPRGATAWRGLAAAALGANVLWPILLALGLTMTSGSHAALIMASLPVLAGLIAVPVDSRWPGGRWWLGCAIAFAGTLWLIFRRGTEGQAEASVVGDLLVLLGCAAAAFGYVAGARAASNVNAWQVTLWGLVLAGLLLLPGAALIDLAELPDAGREAWLGIVYLALVSSVLGYALWYWALAKGGIARIGSFQFLQPLISLVLAAIILNERLEPVLLLIAAVILSGVWLAQSGGRRQSANLETSK